MNSRQGILYHRDAELFRSAIRFTSATTGFNERLIEKDYYCSVALDALCFEGTLGMVFKGGTCLSKVYAEFYRLSEDLDFSISTPVTATRKERSRNLTQVRRKFDKLPVRQDCFRIDEPLRGFNESTQYVGRLAYTSVVTGQDEFVKIEVGLREPIVEAPEPLAARTILLDPFRGAPAVAEFPVPVLSLHEAYSEKLRAALTRDEPAIRDFFDVDHAISTGRIAVTDSKLIQLLRQKLSVPGNSPVDVAQGKRRNLRSQLDTQLQPVLREADFNSFDLDRAFDFVAKMAAAAGA
jgi:predicted nucleotidyltransferase component of viral defense system